MDDQILIKKEARSRPSPLSIHNTISLNFTMTMFENKTIYHQFLSATLNVDILEVKRYI